MNIHFYENSKIIIKDFYEKYANIILTIITTFISFLIAYLSTPRCLFLVLTIISFISFVLLYIYFYKKVYTPIKLTKSEFSINFSNEINPFYYKIPSLIIDECITLKLSLNIRLLNSFKKNMKKNSPYTIIIEKDKSLEVSSIPEYVKDTDNEDETRNNTYYYLVQEYTGQTDLDFEFLFTCSDKINLNRICKIYLEYEDVHEKIINKKFDEITFKNKFFDEEFYITNFDERV